MFMRRRTNHEIVPDLTLQTVWDECTKMPLKNSHARHNQLATHLRCFDANAKEGILSELLQIEADSLRQDNRLHYIREKIMDLVDRKVSAGYLRHMLDSNSHHSSDTEKSRVREISLEHALADCEIQITILRAYIHSKYGDELKNDWLDQYESISDFYHSKLMNKNSPDNTQPFYFDGAAMEPTEENFQMCREKCLDAYVSQEFNIHPAKVNWFYHMIHALKRKSIWRKLIS
jgi:hypothetical protein